jgi:phospholipase C
MARHQYLWTRREFLKALGAAAAVGAAGGGLVFQESCKKSPAIPKGLEKIDHFIFIMQENQSFDHYFGTYPGADGPPPGTALLDATDGTMVPYHHLTSDIDFDAPHDWFNAQADINGGKMDGFLSQAYTRYALTVPTYSTQPGYNPKEIMGYYDGSDIPNYWNYARLYVLNDHMFESVSAYSLSSHLYMLAAQAGGYVGTPQPYPTEFDFPEITELLANDDVSWNYYVTSGKTLDSQGRAIGSAADQANDPDQFTLWNPLPAFPKVQNDSTQRIRMVDTAQFYADAAAGTLPSVSWICPFFLNPLSDHPAFKGGTRTCMAYVTGLINAVQQSPNWGSSAIFVSWDDWGGYYDHVPPPKVDIYGYGMRVPSFVVSPYAKQGYVDKKVYSFDSWLKTIERRWGIPSMTKRDRDALDMMECFDFTQQPRAPVVLDPTTQGTPYPCALQTIKH